MSEKIRVIKKWGHTPKVHLQINQEGQSVEMEFDDFLFAVREELTKELPALLSKQIGSVTWTFKQETFDAKISEALNSKEFAEALFQATEKVIYAMKVETMHNFTK